MKKITNEEKELLVLKEKLELVINKTENPNSYEVGKTGNRHKIYYDKVEELRLKLLDLKALGLINFEESGIDITKLKETK